MEKEKKFPVSFLCNRETTNVPNMQPGFLNGISVPLWSVIVEIMPGMGDHLEAFKENVAKWQQYEETEDDKLIY